MSQRDTDRTAQQDSDHTAAALQRIGLDNPNVPMVDGGGPINPTNDNMDALHQRTEGR